MCVPSEIYVSSVMSAVQGLILLLCMFTNSWDVISHKTNKVVYRGRRWEPVSAAPYMCLLCVSMHPSSHRRSVLLWYSFPMVFFFVFLVMRGPVNIGWSRELSSNGWFWCLDKIMIRFLVSNHLGLLIRACTYRRPVVRSIAVAVDINGIPRMFFVAMWPPLRFESFTSYGTPVNFYSQMAADLPLGDHTKIVTTYIPVSSTLISKLSC